jgi:hypothetical protein
VEIRGWHWPEWRYSFWPSCCFGPAVGKLSNRKVSHCHKHKSRVRRPAFSLWRPLLADLVEFCVISKQLRIPEGDLYLLRALQRYEIPFVIIGGHAARFHGVERDVDDLDILVDSAVRAEDLRAVVIEALGYTPRADLAEYGMPYKWS